MKPDAKATHHQSQGEMGCDHFNIISQGAKGTIFTLTNVEIRETNL